MSASKGEYLRWKNGVMIPLLLRRTMTGEITVKNSRLDNADDENKIILCIFSKI